MSDRKLLFLAIIAVVALVMWVLFVSRADAAVCFLQGERISGLNKICFYECPTGQAAITIRSVQLCPLTVRG